MRVDSTYGNIELARNLLRRESVAAELHHFHLPARHLRNIIHSLDIAYDFLYLIRFIGIGNRRHERKQLVLYLLVLAEDLGLSALDA